MGDAGVTHHLLGVAGSYPMLLALWLLPLAGAVICWTFGPQLRLRAMAGWLVSALVGASFVLGAFVARWDAERRGSRRREPGALFLDAGI